MFVEREADGPVMAHYRANEMLDCEENNAEMVVMAETECLMQEMYVDQSENMISTCIL